MGNFFYTLIIYPLYILIECIYTFCKRITDDKGLAVIGVSVGITLLCLPLYAVAERWQHVQREKVKAMQPQLDRIKRAFHGDKRYMITTAFYREQGYNPIMALRSSFGLLVQIPFFIAAYTFLSHLENLKGAPFLFIKDMGAADALFHVGSFPVNVLPIAMTLINCLSGALYTKGFPLRDKIQVYGMALIFLVILYPSPSGLVLYWTCNNIFSMVKNIFYKLKNPLKAFYLFCCPIVAGMAVYVLFFFSQKLQYKLLFTAVLALFYMIPLLVRGVGMLLDTTLSPLVQDKKRRMTVYLLSCLALFLLIGLALPTRLISSSPVEFSGIGSHESPFYFIGTTVLQAAGIFCFWAVCIFLLFDARVQAVMASVLCVCAFCSLLNAYPFMLRYGHISETLTFLSLVDFKTLSPVSLVNAAVILAIILTMPLILRAARTRLATSALGIVVLALGINSVINCASIAAQFAEFRALSQASSATRLEPVFHLAKDKPNVIVFMLDRAQSQFVPAIFEEHPELAETYSGFTFYNNVISFNRHTLQGSPGIYGGYEYTPSEMNRRSNVPLREKHNEALLLLPRIFTEQGGFSAVITDSSWANYSDFFDVSFAAAFPQIETAQLSGAYSALWNKEHADTRLDTAEIIIGRNLLFFSFMRSSPVCVREILYKKGSYWSSNDKVTDMKKIVDWYAPLDYLCEITDVSSEHESLYACVVNELTHESAFLQAPEYVPQNAVTDYGSSSFAGRDDYHTQAAAFLRIGKWLVYLKENGVYDNTRIIIVSDHGSDSTTEPAFEVSEDLVAAYGKNARSFQSSFHCLLLFKDFAAGGNFSQDDIFMTNADTVSLALSGLFDSPQNPFTGAGIPLDTAALKKDGVFISASDVSTPYENHGAYTFSIRPDEWWKVQDPIFAARSWKHEAPEGGQK